MHRVLVSFTDTKALSASEIVILLMSDVRSSQDWRCTAVHMSTSGSSSTIELETENTFQSTLYMTKDIAELGDLHNIMFSFKSQSVPKDSQYTVILSVYDLYTDLDHLLESAESDNTNAVEPDVSSFEDLPSLTAEDVNSLVDQALAADEDSSDAEESFRLGVAKGYQLLMDRITKDSKSKVRVHALTDTELYALDQAKSNSEEHMADLGQIHTATDIEE